MKIGESEGEKIFFKSFSLLKNFELVLLSQVLYHGAYETRSQRRNGMCFYEFCAFLGSRVGSHLRSPSTLVPSLGGNSSSGQGAC